MICAALVAVLLAGRPSGHHEYRQVRHARRATYHAARQTSTAEAALRRRVGRLLQLAQLEQRAAELHDFLVRAHTETPSFIDDEIHSLVDGLRVGPTIVARDFLGSPVIRARVRNVQAFAIFAVVQAHIRGKDGATSDAAIALTLAAGEVRSIELVCPSAVAPDALDWTVTIL